MMLNTKEGMRFTVRITRRTAAAHDYRGYLGSERACADRTCADRNCADRTCADRSVRSVSSVSKSTHTFQLAP